MIPFNPAPGHDFLLMLHSNHRPISHRFRDKRRFPSKIARKCQFFLPHVYLTPPPRSSAAIPDVEIRPETETRPEPDIDYLAEIQVSMSAICEEGCSSRHITYLDANSLYATARSRHLHGEGAYRHSVAAPLQAAQLVIIIIMRPSSLGGGRILRRTLSVCLSVRPVRGSSFLILQ